MKLTDKVKKQILDFKLTDRYHDSEVSKRLIQELEHLLETGFLGYQDVSPTRLNICMNDIYLEQVFKEQRIALIKINLYVSGHLPEIEFYLPHPIYSDLDHMNIEVHSTSFFDFINRYKQFLETNNAD